MALGGRGVISVVVERNSGGDDADLAQLCARE